MQFIIEEKLANAILDYLVRRPYLEVANLVQSIHLLKPLETKSSKQDSVETIEEGK